jgi:hypothetical protein
LPVVLLSQRHVDDFELQTVRPETVESVVAARSKWELAGTVEDFCAERAHQLECGINLLVCLHVERDVMKAGLVKLKAMVRQSGFRLPDIERRPVGQIDVEGEVGTDPRCTAPTV